MKANRRIASRRTLTRGKVRRSSFHLTIVRLTSLPKSKKFRRRYHSMSWNRLTFKKTSSNDLLSNPRISVFMATATLTKWTDFQISLIPLQNLKRQSQSTSPQKKNLPQIFVQVWTQTKSTTWSTWSQGTSRVWRISICSPITYWQELELK